MLAEAKGGVEYSAGGNMHEDGYRQHQVERVACGDVKSRQHADVEMSGGLGVSSLRRLDHGGRGVDAKRVNTLRSEESYVTPAPTTDIQDAHARSSDAEEAVLVLLHSARLIPFSMDMGVALIVVDCTFVHGPSSGTYLSFLQTVTPLPSYTLAGLAGPG